MRGRACFLILLRLRAARTLAPRGDNQFVYGVAFRLRDLDENAFAVKRDGGDRVPDEEVQKMKVPRSDAEPFEFLRAFLFVK